MPQEDVPVIFEVIRVCQSRRKPLFFIPLALAVVAWGLAQLAPKKYEHEILLTVGQSQTAGAELNEAVEMANLEFKDERPFADGSAKLALATISRTTVESGMFSYANLTVRGTSPKALTEGSQAIVSFISNKMDSPWRMRRASHQVSLHENKEQTVNLSRTIDELQKKVLNTPDLTKSLAFRLTHESLAKDLAALRSEGEKKAAQLADDGDRPVKVSETPAGSPKLISLRPLRVAAFALIASALALFAFFYIEYVMRLTGRPAASPT